jgi:hypothetical protein
VWSLAHAAGTRSVFVPGIAGLNLEHVFDGEHDAPPEVFFEPRNAPMTFTRLSDAEAELHQPPTPTFHVESWTRFTLAAAALPGHELPCVPTQHVFRRGYMGVFWASYMTARRTRACTSSAAGGRRAGGAGDVGAALHAAARRRQRPPATATTRRT